MDEKKFVVTGIEGLKHLINTIFDGIDSRIVESLVYSGDQEKENQFCLQLGLPDIAEDDDKNSESGKIIDFRITLDSELDEHGIMRPKFSLEYAELTGNAEEDENAEYGKLF